MPPHGSLLAASLSTRPLLAAILIYNKRRPRSERAARLRELRSHSRGIEVLQLREGEARFFRAADPRPMWARLVQLLGWAKCRRESPPEA